MKLPNIITLEVLLHYHYSTVPWDAERRKSNASEDAHRWLYLSGMIAGNQMTYTVTEKGAAFIDHIKNQPLPVSKTIWEIPTNASET